MEEINEDSNIAVITKMAIMIVINISECPIVKRTSGTTSVED